MTFAKPVTQSKSESENQSLNCRAIGCPMRWSVDVAEASKLCSYHAWSDHREWPAITESLSRNGPWQLSTGGESPTVRDMKTRIRGRLSAPSLP